MALQVVERGQRFTRYRDAATGQGQLVASIDDQHFHDGAAWQPVLEAFEADATEGFAVKADKLRHIIRLADDGKRRMYPRRNITTEYVELGIPQFWTGSQWNTLTLGSPTSPAPNVRLWDRPTYSLQVTLTTGQLKLDIILKTNAAAKRIRWPVSLTGLTRSGRNLISTTDDTVVCRVDPIWGVDANGVEVPIVTSITAGFVEFTADTAGLTFPVHIDPTLTSQPAEAASADTYMQSDGGADIIQEGLGGFIATGHFGTPQTNRLLIKFDLSTIGTGDTITDATLTLTVDSNFLGTSHNLVAYRVLRAWVEAQATWNNYATGNAWGTAGAGNTTTDREAAGIGTAAVTSGSTTTVSWTLTASAVQGWTSGALTNNGIVLIASDETNTTLIRWKNSSDATAGNRPKLVVNYTTGGAAGAFPFSNRRRARNALMMR